MSVVIYHFCKIFDAMGWVRNILDMDPCLVNIPHLQ